MNTLWHYTKSTTRTQMTSFPGSDEEVMEILAYIQAETLAGPPEEVVVVDNTGGDAGDAVSSSYLTAVIVILVVVLLLALVALVIAVQYADKIPEGAEGPRGRRSGAGEPVL